MRKDTLCLLLAMLVLFSSQSLYAQSQGEQFPEFEFDVWGRPPSREVYRLSEERAVQKILYSIKEKSLSPGEIAVRVQESPDRYLMLLLIGVSDSGVGRDFCRCTIRLQIMFSQIRFSAYPFQMTKERELLN